MIQGLYSVADVTAMIEKGDTLLLAGDAPLLSQLPKGKWIAGATSRFVESGKTLVTTRDKIFVHNITNIAAEVKINAYDPATINNIFDDAFNNGFSVLIVPFMSDVLSEFGANCSNYSNFASRAVCGWVAVGPIYSEYERGDVSLVFSGETGMSYVNVGMVMHIGLHEGKYAEVHAISPFKPDDGDTIIFEENGQHVENVLVNGVRQNFRQYLIDKKIDRSNKFHNVLVGDHDTGIIMNVTIFEETEKDLNKFVTIGAPVYKGVPYRFSKVDTESSYESTKPSDGEIVFSLSCITNYVRPDIFLKYLPVINGPFAYGEIAYFLLNHATVYVTVGNLSD